MEGELIILMGGFWFAICALIGLLLPKKEHCGPDAVENFVNIREDGMNTIVWFAIGTMGLMLTVSMGLIWF